MRWNEVALTTLMLSILVVSWGCSNSTPPDPKKYVDLLQTFNGNVGGGVDYQFDSASHNGSIGQQLNLGQTLENQAKTATIVVTPVGFPKRVYQGVSIYGTQARSGVFEEVNIPLWLQEFGSGNPTWNSNKIVLIWETRNVNGKNYEIPENFRSGFRSWATSYCSGNPLVSTFTEREGNDDPSVTAPMGEIRIFPDNVIAGIVNVSYANGSGVGAGRLLVNYLFSSQEYGMIPGEMNDLFSGTANQTGNSPIANLRHGARIWAENWQGFEMRADGEYLNNYPGQVQSGNLSYVQVNYVPGSPSMMPGMGSEYEAVEGARWKGGRTPNINALAERPEIKKIKLQRENFLR